VREKDHEVDERDRLRSGTSTPSLRRGAAVKIGKSGQGPRAPNKKIRGCKREHPQKVDPGARAQGI